MASTRVWRVDVLLGIDMGTGSTKGVLVDVSGSVLASEVIAHSMNLPRPGWAEVDAEALWWREVCEISTALMAQVPPGGVVAGMCVSGVGPCLVLCDDDLRPLRPAILYGIDTRASVEIEALTDEFGERDILDGQALCSRARPSGPSWSGCAAMNPRCSSGRRVGTDRTLTSRPSSPVSTSWITTPPASAIRCTPSANSIGTSNGRNAFAVIYRFRGWCGQATWWVPCRRRPQPQTGVPAGTPVAAGTVDAYSEAFSVGVRQPGDQMLMYGSTMFLVQIIDEYHSDPALWATAGVEQHSRALAAGTSTAGSLIGWLQKVTGGASFDDLTAEAQLVPPGSEGLLMLPYFAGERTPVFDPHARGVVAGLTLRHGRGHLFRAAYEGISFGIRQILERFDNAQPCIRTVAVGGGLRSPVWTQTLSDITGRTQLVPAQALGASYGDALLAAIGVGLVPPQTDWARIAREINPDPRNRDRYDELYGTWCELYPATRDQMHRLSAEDPTSAAQ